MPLKLMYITNDEKVATIAENAGVDRIFVDLEYIGKDLRQGGMDTVQNHHTTADVRKIKSVLKKSELLVRINPIHDSTNIYLGTEKEIDSVVDAGADIIMLPYFKCPDEVKRFINAVENRAKTFLLFETPESINNVDEILRISGIDEVYIGLNDLSLGLGYNFMFKPLANGIIDSVCEKFKNKGLSFGFGGIASLGKGAVSSEIIIAEHYRLGSTCAILSRSFCNAPNISDLSSLENMFNNGVKEIRDFEAFCFSQDSVFFSNNHSQLQKDVKQICGE